MRIGFLKYVVKSIERRVMDTIKRKKWQSFLCNYVAEIISEICDISRKQIFNRKRACSSPNNYYTDMLRYNFPFFLTVDLYKTGKTSRIPSNSLLNIWKYLINKKDYD